MPNQEQPAQPQESKQQPPPPTKQPLTAQQPLNNQQSLTTSLQSPPPPSTASSTATISSNWLIHALYTRQEYASCLLQIDELISATNGQCEYGIYIKALINRQQGRINDSLLLFQQATLLNPHNINNLKQVGRSLFLLGKHKQAIEVYTEAQRIGIDDWEVWYNKGLCYIQLKLYAEALDALQQSNALQRHDSTYLQIGKVHTLQENYEAAIEVYTEALDHSPDNPDLLTTVGLLYLRLGQNYRAFDYLGSSLAQDPRNPKSILAAGSIIQDHNDMDVALVKYRIAAVQTPNSAQLWNNIGMCFFGKQRYVAAIACLKRALYLDPFEWIISYNLGLVHLNTGQYASAFHYLSSSINLKPDFPSSYMYLAICLSRLDDIDNAIAAYEKATSMEADHLFHLNFAVTCWLADRKDKARQQWGLFLGMWNEMGEEMRGADNEVVEMMVEMERLMVLDEAKVGAAAAAAAGSSGKLKPREKKAKAGAE